MTTWRGRIEDGIAARIAHLRPNAPVDLAGESVQGPGGPEAACGDFSSSCSASSWWSAASRSRISFYQPPMRLMPAPAVFLDGRVAASSRTIPTAHPNPEIGLFYATNREALGTPEDRDYARVPGEDLQAGVVTIRIGEDGTPWDKIYEWSTGAGDERRPFLHLEGGRGAGVDRARTSALSPDAAGVVRGDRRGAGQEPRSRTSSSMSMAPTPISSARRARPPSSSTSPAATRSSPVRLADGRELPALFARHGHRRAVGAGVCPT